ncbi:WD40 repeat-like protein [Auriculariales sp. MPI-PUGE-AT-0066]|nr:WD40 repeat-like protein [Auriculariales sp. MPI-PUGE-AT-0066]
MPAHDNELLAGLDWQDDHESDSDYQDDGAMRQVEDAAMDAEFELEDMEVDVQEDDENDEDYEDVDDDDDNGEASGHQPMVSVTSSTGTQLIALEDIVRAASELEADSSVPSGIDVVALLRLARSLGLVNPSSVSAARRTTGSQSMSDRLEHPQEFASHTEPQEAGVELLRSGQFGSVKMHSQAQNGGRGLARYLHRRECAQRPGHFRREELTRPMVPNSTGTVVATFDDDVYSGQYSDDGNFYYTCCRNFQLDIFSTTEPRVSASTSRRGHLSSQTTMRRVCTTTGQGEGWTITDSHLSPDNERLIYASMSSAVYLTRTGISGSTFDRSATNAHSGQQTPLRFNYEYGNDTVEARVWSCRFSADGNEIVAGGSQHIFVYDLIGDRQTVQIPAHGDDINSCCWADTQSGNVLISGSDDTYIKVWDRRSLGTTAKPSGVLIGHVEGITYVAPKGDGRYVISNGKDQTLRLWDLRMMRSHEDYVQCRGRHYGDSEYDYRYGNYPRLRRGGHPKDCSVMQYRGHQVLRTLIRCNFSPSETTGGSYIYSGSSNGYVHIWSIDGTEVQKLDRQRSLPISFDPSDPDPADGDLPRTRVHGTTRWGMKSTGVIVRDVSWHPRLPTLMSTAWESANTKSNVARHEWKGVNKHWATIKAGSLEDMAIKEAEESRERKRRRLHIPGQYYESDEFE